MVPTLAKNARMGHPLSWCTQQNRKGGATRLFYGISKTWSREWAVVKRHTRSCEQETISTFVGTISSGVEYVSVLNAAHNVEFPSSVLNVAQFIPRECSNFALGCNGTPHCHNRASSRRIFWSILSNFLSHDVSRSDFIFGATSVGFDGGRSPYIAQIYTNRKTTNTGFRIFNNVALIRRHFA